MPRLTDEDRAFIADNYEFIGARACAEAVGCSEKTVYNLLGKLKIGKKGPARVRTYDTLTELKRSKKRIIGAMAAAPPAAVAGLSKELREVMREIDRMEGEGGGEDPLAALAKSIADAM